MASFERALDSALVTLTADDVVFRAADYSLRTTGRMCWRRSAHL